MVEVILSRHGQWDGSSRWGPTQQRQPVLGLSGLTVGSLSAGAVGMSDSAV